MKRRDFMKIGSALAVASLTAPELHAVGHAKKNIDRMGAVRPGHGRF